MASENRPGGSPEEPGGPDQGDEELPETGAWSFEADEPEDGPPGSWGQPGHWDEGYDEPGGEDAPDEEVTAWGDPGTGYIGDPYRPGQPVPYARTRQEALAAYGDDYATAVQGEGWVEGPGYGAGRPPGRRTNGPWPELVMVAAVAVIAAALILAITSANRANLSSPPEATTLPVATSLVGAATKPSNQVTQSTSPAASTAPEVTSTTSLGITTTLAPPSQPAAKALGVDPGVESSLVRSWIASNPGGADLGAKDVSGTVPGEVHYGVQPSAHVWWAIAAFAPSATVVDESSTAAGQEKLAQFQDREYAFSWKAGPVWTLLGYATAGSCPSQLVPRSVLAAWSLCNLHPGG